MALLSDFLPAGAVSGRAPGAGKGPGSGALAYGRVDTNTPDIGGMGNGIGSFAQQQGPGVGGGPSPSVNPYDLGRAFHDYYGGKPAHQIVSEMQAGQPTAGNATTAGVNPGAGNPPTPEQSGQMNAKHPGHFRGTPENGWSPTQEAGGQSNNEQGGPPAPETPPAPQPTPAPQPVAQKSALADFAPQPTTQAKAPASGGATVADFAPPKAAGQEKMLPVPNVPIIVGSTLLGNESTTGHDTPPPSGTNTNTSVGADTGRDYTHTTWFNPQTGQMRQNFDPLAFIAANPEQALTGKNFWVGSGLAAAGNAGNFPNLPSPGQTHYNNLAINGTAPVDYAALGIKDPGLQRLVGKAQDLQTQIDQLNKTPNLNSTARAALFNYQHQLQVAQAALGAYGIQYSAAAPTPGTPGGEPTQPSDPSAPAAGGGGGHPVDQPPSNQTGPPNVPVKPGDTFDNGPVADPNYPAGGGSGGGGTTDPTQAADTPLSQASGDIKDLRNLAAKLAGDGASAAEVAKWMELIQGFIKDSNATQDKQTGLGILDAAGAAAKNDPNRAAAQNTMSSILAKPDSTDWTQIRAKYAADSDRAARENADAIGSAYARRGLGAATATGAAGESLRKSDSSKAMGLGDLSIQQSEKERQAQYDALNAEDRQYQLYNVGDYNMDAQRAQYLGNPATPMSSPTAGLTSSTVNLQAAQTAADTARAAGQFSYADAAKLLGSLLGTVAKV